MSKAIPFLLFFPYLSSFGFASSDTLTTSGSLSINHTLVSKASQFELGFFTTTNTTTKNKYYLGIWYFNLGLPKSTIVWVANRDSPAWSSSVSLTIDGSGRVVLSELGRSESVSSSNNSQTTNPVLQLLDNGNLIVTDQANVGTDDYLWQSFDHPTDTLLPPQKLGWDNKTGLDRYITSWKNNNDPSSGDYSFRLNHAPSPEAFLLKGGVQKIFRTEAWVGTRSGVNITVYDTPDEVYFIYTLSAYQTKKVRAVLDPSGKILMSAFDTTRKEWVTLYTSPQGICDDYAQCGPNGVCNASNTLLAVCRCPDGFDHANPSEWNTFGDGSYGCKRRSSLDCDSDTFIKLGDMKTPESGVGSVLYKNKGLEECREMCLKDCNCTAYASWPVASGCVMWSGDLVDMRTYTWGGQDLYIRVAASPLAHACISTKDDKFDCSSRRSLTELVLDSLSVNHTLVSDTSQFDLGFFTTTNNNNNTKNKYYLGIWYFNLGLPESTIVWVANRDSPAGAPRSVSLGIDGSGRIVISELGRSEFVSSPNLSKATDNTVLQLLDNGNLIVRDQADVGADDYLWQSFDHPTDTLLPPQKLGWDSKTGQRVIKKVDA